MRIAIFTLGSRGDVQPYIALGKEAIKRGHSAIICTGRTFEQLIRINGVEFREAASDLMAMLKTEEGQMVFNNAAKHPLKTKKYLSEVVNPAFRKTLDQFWETAQGADLIVYHPKAFGTPDMALALGIPCVSMPPVPITYPIEEFPNLAIAPTKSFGKKLNKLTYNIMAMAESASIKEVNDFREKTLKLPKRKAGIYTFKINEQHIPIIYPISNHLFEDVKSWENKVFLPGFFYLDTEEEELNKEILSFIEAGDSPIIVSFSSMPLKDPITFKNILVEALAKTNNRAIVLTGESGLIFESSKNILAIESAPHTLLFPYGKGIVHHGGVGTMAATLKSGKPQFIIPFSVDQPFWANRLYNNGYSLKPIKEKELTVENLSNSFLKMDSDEVIAKAKDIQKRIENENGAKKAVMYLEDIVRINFIK